ncbi:ladderlectin-like [Biomphalaria glabrata]|uniref:Ladderlectin-like n=1 Tax=Biomphalaria glabrata TaxID=6526 RepID=A0A2C9LIH8_BIOGL|nr:ladderlectin-like [Biomphalaria glabrata]
MTSALLTLLLIGTVHFVLATDIRVSLDNARFFPPFAYLNKLYFISRLTFPSFSLARAACESVGAYVAEIDGQAEIIFLQLYVNRTDVARVYISGTDAASDGRFIFQRTGVTLNIFDWFPSEPNNFNGFEDCIELVKERQSRMNDIVCNNPFARPSVLCEKDLF